MSKYEYIRDGLFTWAGGILSQQHASFIIFLDSICNLLCCFAFKLVLASFSFLSSCSSFSLFVFPNSSSSSIFISYLYISFPTCSSQIHIYLEVCTLHSLLCISLLLKQSTQLLLKTANNKRCKVAKLCSNFIHTSLKFFYNMSCKWFFL